ncbi:MAG: phosphoenolpyruvate synthase [Nanoarchaeota archaeon]|nr:phosphoenolpyruvate synthase [Nanoarchaeota archaeon]
MPEKKEVSHKEKYIKWFSEIRSKDVILVGGKGANLGEMTSFGIPVPQGFVITSQAYSYFLKKTELENEIYDLLKEFDIEDTEELEKRAKQIREKIEKADIPKELEEEIIESYNSLSIDEGSMQNISQDALSILKMSEPVFVAIRSSATAEDSSAASFAGQQETFLNVKGEGDVLVKVKKCFSSLFTPRSIYYRIKKGFEHKNVLNAVVIQKMVDSSKSGVIFSKDPLNKNENVIIEAVFGLGEGIVSGKIKPDHYVVSRDLEILSEKTEDKKIAITRDSSGENKVVKLTEEKSNQQVLSDYEIKRLADFALRIEKHYNVPQDIEFALDVGEIFIVQTRPITTLDNKKAKVIGTIKGKELVSGLGASPGIGSGKVKIIIDLKDLSKIIKGDVLVTEMTSPDMVVAMQKCAAIVTDEGGMTSHASIVSREMGIPAVVGTRTATKTLKDGTIVTVDGSNGKIYEGKIEGTENQEIEVLPIVETKTKIKVINDLPTFAERASKTKCKEVGLLRIEGIIAESGKHPFFFLNKNIEEYENIIFRGINKISEYFEGLWVRTSDIRTDEYQNLDGAPKEIEANPMLGMHGIRAGLKQKEILEAEIKALKKVSEKGKKVGLLLPQVILVDEVRQIKKIMKELNANLDIGVMIETPASVQIIEELCKEGINFISFGTNDLTQYTLAIDRGNEDVQYLYNETHPAILSQIKKVIETCKENNVETSICGQAGSNKDMVEFLVGLGIDSISVNADKANEISKFVKEIEEKNSNDLVEQKDIEENNPEKEDIGEETIVKTENVEKESYPIKCSKCGKDSEVPFKPDGKRPVFCKDCYLEKRGIKQNKQKNKISEKINESLNNAIEVFKSPEQEKLTEAWNFLEKTAKELSPKENQIAEKNFEKIKEITELGEQSCEKEIEENLNEEKQKEQINEFSKEIEKSKIMGSEDFDKIEGGKVIEENNEEPKSKVTYSYDSSKKNNEIESLELKEPEEVEDYEEKVMRQIIKEQEEYGVLTEENNNSKNEDSAEDEILDIF